MRELIGRYTIGLLAGIVCGFLFPKLIPSWVFLPILVATVVITEVVGYWGFGNGHWNEYRMSSYALYSAVVVCAVLGILFGSGKIGSLLVSIGTLISR